MSRTVVAIVLVFIVLSAINFWYYRHNVQLIYETMALLSTDTPTAEESAAADQVARGQSGTIVVRMTLPGERRGWIGRETAIIAVLGGTLFLALRRAKVET